jgi:hypothetical protein
VNKVGKPSSNNLFGESRRSSLYEIVHGDATYIEVAKDEVFFGGYLCNSDKYSFLVAVLYNSRLVGMLPWHAPLTTTFSEQKRCP